MTPRPIRKKTPSRPGAKASARPKRAALAEYHRKRDFAKTHEPSEGGERHPLLYVIQKHAASRLHYDLRLELGGTLKSWAVPKGPSLDPAERRLAVHVEDHPIEYGAFEGTIPKGEYGGGTVMLWDRGHWEPAGDKDPQIAYEHGHLEFALHGERLRGTWMLVRMTGKSSENGKNWLLIKKRGGTSASSKNGDPVATELTSVASGRPMEGIAKGHAVVPAKKRSRKARAAEAVLTPGEIAGARKAALPSELPPQRATLVDAVPGDGEWVHEIKFDGYRMLAFLRNGRVRLQSRNGKDWTARFPVAIDALKQLPVKAAILDGEMVAVQPDGTSSFQALQNAMQEGRASRIVYQVFDLPHLDGYDLSASTLLDRKRALRTLLSSLPSDGTVRYTDHVAGQGKEFYEQACRLGLEGIMSKRADSPYVTRRTRHWLKVKCSQRQELLVVGYTDPQGARTGLGALLLGYHDDGRLLYAGKVGTGFDEKTLRDLVKRLRKLAVRKSPLHPSSKGPRDAHWVRPTTVAEVQFTEWTADGRLRHPAFLGIREDKDPREVRRERPAAAPSEARPARGRRAATGRARNAAPNVRLTNPDRVLWPEVPLTKRQLADYYAAVADAILPQIAGRPLAIVRCPGGRTEACFFQKNWSESLPDSVKGVSVGTLGGTKSVHMTIDDLDGLTGLVQIGALEIHPWNARSDRLERPDRIVFDLDPGPGIAWKEVVDAARQVREHLRGLGLESFVRTTGGKGIHVVLPIARRATWDEVKAFARSVALDLTRAAPSRYVAVASKAKRAKRIFIDWLRNARGATAIASYSTRAREGAPVAAPVGWDELSSLSSGADFNVASMPQRVRRRRDPWAAFDSIQQMLPKPVAPRRAHAAS